MREDQRGEGRAPLRECQALLSAHDSSLAHSLSRRGGVEMRRRRVCVVGCGGGEGGTEATSSCFFLSLHECRHSRGRLKTKRPEIRCQLKEKHEGKESRRCSGLEGPGAPLESVGVPRSKEHKSAAVPGSGAPLHGAARPPLWPYCVQGRSNTEGRDGGPCSILPTPSVNVLRRHSSAQTWRGVA